MTKRTGRPKGSKPGWNGTIEERLKRRTAVAGPDECWLWNGYRNDDGYGVIDGKSIGMGITRTHRVAYVLANGPIPDGYYVLHKCDNPPCVNPAHLFVGTQLVNVADREAKGRGNQPKGERHHKSKLTIDDVAEIRRRFAGNLPKRGCQHSEQPNYSRTAREFGVSVMNIRNIVNGRIWRQQPAPQG